MKPGEFIAVLKRGLAPELHSVTRPSSKLGFATVAGAKRSREFNGCSAEQNGTATGPRWRVRQSTPAAHSSEDGCVTEPSSVTRTNRRGSRASVLDYGSPLPFSHAGQTTGHFRRLCWELGTGTPFAASLPKTAGDCRSPRRCRAAARPIREAKAISCRATANSLRELAISLRELAISLREPAISCGAAANTGQTILILRQIMFNSRRVSATSPREIINSAGGGYFLAGDGHFLAGNSRLLAGISRPLAGFAQLPADNTQLPAGNAQLPAGNSHFPAGNTKSPARRHPFSPILPRTRAETAQYPSFHVANPPGSPYFPLRRGIPPEHASKPNHRKCIDAKIRSRTPLSNTTNHRMTP